MRRGLDRCCANACSGTAMLAAQRAMSACRRDPIVTWVLASSNPAFRRKRLSRCRPSRLCAPSRAHAVSSSELCCGLLLQLLSQAGRESFDQPGRAEANHLGNLHAERRRCLEVHREADLARLVDRHFGGYLALHDSEHVIRRALKHSLKVRPVGEHGSCVPPLQGGADSWQSMLERKRSDRLSVCC